MLRRLSVKSKLLATVLGVSIASILVVGLISFTTGQRAVSDAVLDNLTAQRDARAELIERYIEGIERQASTLSQDRSVVTAASEFAVATRQLSGGGIDNGWEEPARRFYDDFVAELDAELNVAPAQIRPRDPVSQYLQHHYIMRNDEPQGEREGLDDARDGSFYSRVHARFHPSFRNIAHQFGYYDIFLIEPTENRIVYSVEKEIDFGTSLASGPWGRSTLAELVDRVQGNPSPGKVTFIDYEFYRPSFDEPAAFVAAPIFNPLDQQLVGIIAFQMPLDEIDNTMTSNQGWESAGFGETGEAYLVGNDELMRSTSRLLLEDPAEYRRRVVSAGTNENTADAILSSGIGVLRQSVQTAAAQEGLRGQTGTAVVDSYHGTRSLSSYAPLSLPSGLRWAIVTEQALSESEEPVVELQRFLLIATGLVVLVLTVLAMLFSARFVRPINALIEWAGLVGDGDMEQPVPVKRGDEIGQLASSVEQMVSDMRGQRQTIDDQRDEMRSLILNLMPAQIAERVTAGDVDVADAYPNVTIIWASLAGFSRFTRTASPGQGKRVLDEIITSFDAAAEEIGVEKIRGGSWGYLAAVGLMEPRLDQRQRAMEFAVAIDQKLESLSNLNRWQMDLRVGVASGDAEAGIVGDRQIAFEVWGDPVSEAAALADTAPNGRVYVSADIADAVGERYRFEQMDAIDADGKPVIPFAWLEDDGGRSGSTADAEVADAG